MTDSVPTELILQIKWGSFLGLHALKQKWVTWITLHVEKEIEFVVSDIPWWKFTSPYIETYKSKK